MKKLIIDNIIFQWQKAGGVSVVWYEIISRLLKRDLPVEFIEYEHSCLNKYHKHLNIPKCRILKTVSARYGAIKRYLPVDVNSKEPFIFHSSYYKWCRSKNAINVITVHDFTYEYFCHGLRKWIHHWTKSRAIGKARRIICVSENTKNDLIKFFPAIDTSKISVIYNGVSDTFRPLHPSLRYDENDKFLIFVGNRARYKNFDLAVEAARVAGLKLYIIGQKLCDKEKKRVEKLLGQNYVDLGFISNEQLNMLYNKAYVLIYPSSYEGFGIPVIEAQKAGCPVIAMQGSSITEIYGKDSLLIKGKDSGQIVEKIKMLEDRDFRKKVIDEGFKNAKRFSWDKTFEAYLNLYKQL